MKRQHIKLKNTPQVKKYNQALRRASKNKMNKRKNTGIDWSKKDMYEGIGRLDLKPRENKMKKLKEDLREEFDKKWKTVRYSEKKSEYLFLGKFQTRNEIGNALWSWIEKALQEAREEGWQIGHKQTKEDYQAKEEKVVGRIEKELIPMLEQYFINAVDYGVDQAQGKKGWYAVEYSKVERFIKKIIKKIRSIKL